MNILSAHNPVYSSADNSTIDCTIGTDKGSFPFTAALSDSEPHGVKLFQDLISGKYGAIVPYAGSPIALAKAAYEIKIAIPDPITQKIANLTAAIVALGGSLPTDEITAANTTLTALGQTTISTISTVKTS